MASVCWSLVPVFPPCVVYVFSRLVGRCSPALSYMPYIYVTVISSAVVFFIFLHCNLPFLLSVSCYVFFFVIVAVFVVVVTVTFTVAIIYSSSEITARFLFLFECVDQLPILE